MRMITKISLWFLVSLLFMNLVYADGWHLSDYQLHMEEPNQKAVISWDGQTETMILSSAVRSDDLSNFAWVIPIQSYSKPEVTAGNISIFEDLVKYFEKEKQDSDDKVRIAAGEVEVLESKEIDVYDITILKATDSTDLINWLNNNGYKVPEEAKPILDKYVAKGDYYFVANKIDLKNKFKEASDFVEKFNRERSASKTYSRLMDESIMVEFMSNPYLVDTVVNWIVKDIMINVPYENAKYYSQPAFISKEDYEKLREKYKLGEKLTSLYGGLFLDNIISTLIVCDNANCISYIGVDCYSYNPGITFSQLYVVDSKLVSDQWYITAGRCDDLINKFGSLEVAKAEISKIPFNEILNNIEIVKSKMQDIIEPEVTLIKPMKQKLIELIYEKYLLKNGMSTPLKFEFQPHKPYYPLEISSLNLGRSIIEVYVLTVNPVTDQNDILKVEESKKINSDLKNKLERHINLANEEYVTRLSYQGELKELTNDAEFEGEGIMEPPSPPDKERQYSFFQKVWNLISNLFR